MIWSYGMVSDESRANPLSLLHKLIVLSSYHWGEIHIWYIYHVKSYLWIWQLTNSWRTGKFSSVPLSKWVDLLCYNIHNNGIRHIHSLVILQKMMFYRHNLQFLDFTAVLTVNKSMISVRTPQFNKATRWLSQREDPSLDLYEYRFEFILTSLVVAKYYSGTVLKNEKKIKGHFCTLEQDKSDVFVGRTLQRKIPFYSNIALMPQSTQCPWSFLSYVIWDDLFCWM